ncbi:MULTISPECIES: Flp pilus assembly protein CpaB [unclassified Streptomyces]|uniref:Flp pilus assembly protein CpaB n=1 Tax=unclassified Streptomyces TaxID=2593676 RepID=UPI001660CAA2|nr:MULTISPECIES: Flp pilus assembly protein CpaB [unclassified Streptomyces]MBD0711410.1 Flp pilus assembly protein CpaB [Streptomyces sp. CBMA291]MBD0713481.1 Flp pilus assembly protein CpaB [Streptomyces sp. CBMA370]
MNSRQRRGVILLLLSVLCALGAFAGVLAVISDVNSKVGPETTAYRIKGDVEPYTALRPDQFEKFTIPERWLSGTAVTDLRQIEGRIAVTRLKAGSLLQTDMIVKRPELQPGQQEIAIMIDAGTGVAGKITAGATVNIYATFAGEKKGQTSQSRMIVAGARVIDVGRLTPVNERSDRADRATSAVPITFALSTLDTQRVAYAESFAEHVRLALVAPGTGDTPADQRDRTYTLDKDK